MRRRVAAWCVAIAIAACGQVEEAAPTSLGPDDTSSGGDGGPSTSPDDDDASATAPSGDATTQGSASADDATTDPSDTSSADTSGPSGDTTTTEDAEAGTSTTDAPDPTTDDGATTDTPSACDPNGADSACDTCVKTFCCPQVEACAMDVGCWCLANCVSDGGDPFSCSGTCGLAFSPPGAAELFSCAGTSCDMMCGA
jgi:hypothetical protein